MSVRFWPGADPGPLASSEANTMRLLNRLRHPDRLAESGQSPLKLVRMHPKACLPFYLLLVDGRHLAQRSLCRPQRKSRRSWQPRSSTGQPEWRADPAIQAGIEPLTIPPLRQKAAPPGPWSCTAELPCRRGRQCQVGFAHVDPLSVRWPSNTTEQTVPRSV